MEYVDGILREHEKSLMTPAEESAHERARFDAESEARRIVGSPYLLRCFLDEHASDLDVDGFGEKPIKVDGENCYIGDALMIAALHPNPVHKSVILADCAEEITKRVVSYFLKSFED